MTRHDSETATQTLLGQVRFDANGLVPAIAQQHDTGEVLMLAWMNRESLTETAGHRPRLLLQPQPQGAVAQGRDLGPGAAPDGAAA